MTDTVNVKREVLERLVAWINREVPVPTRSATRWAMDITDLLAVAPKAEPVGMAALDRLFYGGKAYIGAEEAVRQIVGLQAELAALRAQPEAPKAEPVIDGAHDQGRFARLGLTSGNILDKMSEAATEIAGWGAGNEAAVMRFAMAEITRLSAQTEAPKVEQEPVAWLLVNGNANSEVVTREHPGEWPNAHVYPLYTHPAPASEELLEALEAWAVEMTAKHGNPNGTDYEQGQNDMGVRVVSYLRSLRAKHKGPQS